MYPATKSTFMGCNMTTNTDHECSEYVGRRLSQMLLSGSGIRLLLVIAAFSLFYWGLLRIESIWAYGVFGFWVILLAPFWIPAIFARNWSRWAWLRMSLALPAMAWYLFLIRLSWHEAWSQHPLIHWGVIAGSIFSVIALGFAHRGFWRLLSLPLGVSIICGTVSLWASVWRNASCGVW